MVISVTVTFGQSGSSSLTSLINTVCLPAELLLTGCFFVFHHSLQTLEFCVKIPGDPSYKMKYHLLGLTNLFWLLKYSVSDRCVFEKFVFDVSFIDLYLNTP